MNNSYPNENPPIPKKSLGQNFLSDRGVLERIISFIPEESPGLVIEIGTGTGNLTQFLCKRFKNVVTIEKDDRLVQWLLETGRIPENCHLLHEDVLDVSFNSILRPFGENEAFLTGNLPYNISSQIVFKLAHEHSFIPSALLLFQKEVAQRVVSDISSKSYGVLSLVAQHFYNVEMVMELSPNLFRPRPKVVSSLVLFKRRKAGPKARDFSTFVRVVKAAFSQRRKKILNSMSHQLKISKKVLEGLFLEAGIEPGSRAEDVSLENYVFLSDLLSSKRFCCGPSDTL